MKSANLKTLGQMQLSIKKGESIVFIGTSGAGKTTLSDIVLELLQSQRAQIVGYVPQSVFLLDDTVRNNVAFGSPMDMIDDKYICTNDINAVLFRGDGD